MSVEALTPWRAALRGVAPELIPAAEAMAERLRLFVGPFPLPGMGDDGEPQGYFGLAQRGPYERLLASEWAMLEAAPLEFLRRAVAGEQLFFALSRRRPAGGRRCVVLVDAGPEQLGNCRLAQLALLMVLDERARAAGAQFLWSSWQAPPGDLAEGFAEGALRRFLEQRSPHPAASEAREAWLALLGSPSAEEERWSIGAAGSGLEDPDLQRVVIGESDEDLACRSLTVEWRPPGRPRKSIELPLPPETARIRLLKDPYEKRLEPSKAKQPRQQKCGLQLESRIVNVSFACGDERLLVRTDTELKMVIFGTRPFDQAPGGRPRSFRFEEGEKLVAAGSAVACMTVVVRREGELAFHRVLKGRERDHRPVVVQSSRGKPATGPGGVCLPDPRQAWERWYFQDGLRTVHVYNFSEQRFEESLDEVDALFAPRGGGVHAVRALTHPENLSFHAGSWKTIWSTDGAKRSRAFAGIGATAFELGAGIWAVGERKLRPDVHCEVVGVARTKASQLAGLLLLGSESHELYHEGLSFRRLLVKARSPIQGVTVGVQRPILAYWTARGGLELISLEDGRSRSLIEEPE